MKKFKTIGTVRFNSGLIGMSDSLAEKRAYALKKTKKKGVYEILATVTFKAGETIELEKVEKVKADLLIALEEIPADTEDGKGDE